MRDLGPKLYCLFSFIAILNCSAPKPVAFKTPVDTTSRPITLQDKKTYELIDLGVFASNEFDGARLNGFEKINDSTAVVVINPENQPINNSPYYAFKSWAKQPKSFYFKFKYPEGFKHRYIPKIKTGNTWAIIDSNSIFKNDSIVTIKLFLTSSPQTIAAQEIQSSKDVEQWFTKLASENQSLVSVNSIGKTPLGRNIPVLDISKGLSTEKDVIVLLTRQHPPEVTGYYAFQSFLETILNGTKVSDEFLTKYHVIAFPIMNPDGVDLGHWRHNSGGVDTNRDWSIYNQPEILQAVTYIDRTLRKSKSKLILGLDFHSTWYDIFYTNEDRATTTMPNFIEDWFAALESNIPNYKVNEASANSDKPTSKGWMLNGHNAVGITYEIGDQTPKEDIQIFGKVSAEEMMKIILTK